MASNTPQCKWKGASGREYTYFVYESPHSFDCKQDGNYIFARLENNAYQPVYIGQGDLGDRCNGNHHKQTDFTNLGVTHILAHLNGKEEDRRAEESDLLAAYTQAYVPTGCNEKIGG